jgi:hypothetical protein
MTAGAVISQGLSPGWLQPKVRQASRFLPAFSSTKIRMLKRPKRGRPRTGSKPVVHVRLAPKQVKKVAQLAELQGFDRSRVLRQLIDLGLESGEVLLLLRRPGATGRTEIERVIRAVAADERVKVTQAAVMRAPSVEREVSALRAEEEQAEAMAAYLHHYLKPPRSL